MSLADRCRSQFSSTIQSRGRGYFRSGHVDLVHADKNRVQAMVEGSYRSEYQIDLDLSEIRRGVLGASCTCPHFEGGSLCKHLWATLLAVDFAHTAAAVLGTGRLTVVPTEPEEDEGEESDDDLDAYGFGRFDDYDDDYDDYHDYDDDGHGRHLLAIGRGAMAGSKPGLVKKGRVKPPSPWSVLAEELRGPASSSSALSAVPWKGLAEKRREAWYVLDVGAALEQGQVVLDLHRRETLKDGQFGKLRNASIEPADVADFTHAEDRRLLDALISCPEDTDGTGYGYRGYGYRSYAYQSEKTSRVVVPSAFFDTLLPELCATGRFVWSLDPYDEVDQTRTIAWDSGPAWRLRLRVEPEGGDDRWQLSGELVRPGESASLDAPVMLFACGLVLFPDRLARHEAADVFPWITLLRQDGKRAVTPADRFDLLRCLWSLPAVPEVDLPEALRVPEVAVEPRPRLQVNKPDDWRRPRRLYANVWFDYDGQPVRGGDVPAGLVDEENQRVLRRDFEREQALFDSLADMKLSHAKPNEQRRGHVWFRETRLTDVVVELVRRGWAVEAEGQLFRRPGSFSASVTSGVDWFELDGEFDYDGVALKLPDLLAAVRRGQKYVQLSDGSQGILPDEWLKQFGTLSGMGEAEDGVLRFAPSQAMLLDALLAAQDNTKIDRKFAAVRKKLRNFDGVKPRGEPRGFTGTLRQYQQEGLGWIRFLQDFGLGGCLADDMGLGKTIQVLALLQQRRLGRRPNGQAAKPSLVVVPRSLIFNWLDEAARFTPNLRVLNYTGLGRARLREQFAEHDVVLTTYGTLRRDVAHLKDTPFDYAILDEATAIKNNNSQAAKASRLVKAEHRLALTGTPVENHLGELWSLFEFLNPGMLGRSAAFQSLSKRATDGDAGTRELLARALAPYLLRRTKEQVLSELPEKTEQTLYCEMKPKQRKQYDQLRDYYRTHLSERIEELGLKKAKIHVLEALLRLRQAACHPGLLDKKKTGEPSAKLDSLVEQLGEVIDEGHKALVFSQFTSLLAIVRKRLDERGFSYEYLDGRTRKRGQKVRRFQEDPDCPLFLISLKAGGHGLNLTAADYVYILDPWWNPAVEAQAVDRAHRIGQTRRVFAYRMICRDTVEERIVELQKSKRDLAEAIISADRNLIRELTAEDLQLLLT